MVPESHSKPVLGTISATNSNGRRKLHSEGKSNPRISPHLQFLGVGVNDLDAMSEEIDNYLDMLLGRKPLPINNGVMSLMESATAMFSRAGEMTAKIQEAEAQGRVLKRSPEYLFRTGKLRTFLDICSKTIELGSRRITWSIKEAEQKEWG